MNLWKLLFLLALVFVGLNYGVPWLKARFDGDRSSILDTPGVEAAGEGARCIAAVRQARNALDAEVRGLGATPLDASAWESTARRLEAAIDESDDDCACAYRSCDRGREAADALRALVAEIDDGIAHGIGLGSTRQLERADDLLGRAQALAVQGK